MTGREENAQHSGTLSYFWLNSLESLLNSFLELDPEHRQHIAPLDGMVVRVKTFSPYMVFYLQFSSDRIEVSPRAPGEVQIRMSGRVRDLVWTFLGLEDEQRMEDKGHLNLWGDTEITNNLRLLMQEFNVRSAAGLWLKSHWPLNQLWQKLSQQDLTWLQDLQPLPELIRETREEVSELRREVLSHKHQLDTITEQLQTQLSYIRFMMVVLLLTLGGGIGAWVVYALS
ncbi:SCP-2 sterol transfer family protein [Fluviicoccus keumensis]|uniref:SCP-2 sterol transfer family protein n=1 Tax=Fluviicoccus keumensis TaxID=1435465 RepID=A0A4Q7YHR1_9GAMM|nr:SCP2 sterol-binding domain-containing protein [Fluviicoccus keumensis]RZU37082.1 SCP-2 sterol transfer family protein [Fluviicoccus keumensis]